MMTDREMLELAAKAVGIPIVFGRIYQVGDELIDCSDAAYVKSDQPDVSDKPWNPLEDDADAFRLAVQLGLMIVVWRDEQMSYAGNEIGDGWVAFEPHDDNPFAATRRAIVREAAKIGSKL